MSAEAANVAEFPERRRAPEARPIHKLRVSEHCIELMAARDTRVINIKKRDGTKVQKTVRLMPVDHVVLTYLAKITDKRTGAARVELATIAERTGQSRTTVVRATRRLIAFELIERQS